MDSEKIRTEIKTLTNKAEEIRLFVKQLDEKHKDSEKMLLEKVSDIENLISEFRRMLQYQ